MSLLSKKLKGDGESEIMRHLTEEAKKVIVEKALNRKDQSIAEIANIHNVGLSTLWRWIRNYKAGKNITTNNAPGSTIRLTKSEQLEHLLATVSLDEARLGSYCREHGLYSFQLQQWKDEFMLQDNNQKKQKIQSEVKALRAENKLLKQDLQRKNKALAETTALLVLKKKANLIFGESKDV